MMRVFEPARLNRLDTANEEQLLEYFRTKVADRLVEYVALHLPQSFWREIVPNLAMEIEPVRHAILALAATQQKLVANYTIAGLQETTVNDPLFALEQYTAVLTKLNSSISTASISTNGTLICCLLLTLCDLWHPGYQQSFKHVFGGLEICKIIKKLSPAKSPLPETTEIDGAMMVPAFEHFADCAVVSLDDITEDQRQILHDFCEPFNPVLPACFLTKEEAYATVDKMLRHIATLADSDSGLVFNQLFDLQAYILTLSSVLEESLNQSADEIASIHFRLLKLHQRMSSMLVANLMGTGTDSNNCEEDFECIIEEMELLIALFKDQALPGGISLLFLTAISCSMPLLQQRALILLHNLQQLESGWSSCTAFQIASHLVYQEQRSFVKLRSIEFDRADNRIRLELENEQAELTLSQLDWKMDENEVNVVHKLEKSSMPRKLVRIGGFSMLNFAFHSGRCHCHV